MSGAARRGTTTVSERAVRRIAERAGAEALPGRGDARASASVRGRRAELSLGVTLPYPAPLAETVREVQRHVVERTRELTGLQVPAARVGVTSLAVVTSAEAAVPEPRERRTARRWWSRRRFPVALLTSVAAVGCGALAFDLVRVHLAHRAAAGWRVSAVHWLSAHGPGDPAVVVGGVLLALTGVCMVTLALTPGRRRQSPVRTSADRVDAAVDRSAVASLVRDAVGDVPGVGAVRVRVRRGRVTVRAGLAFGDRSAARLAATTAAQDTLDACLLGRAPRLRVTVVPEPAWQPPAPKTTDATAPVPLSVSVRAAGGDV
ncbi:DUF6286 domain-containing Asp23/Gls24 family envelope stress response protein [Streptomyces sp. NPDC091280]|uniref:DUF6286 domain-containing Asp23/Gls24 family envelope stress response protein n=1 Tax=Streptomyces sp. NPDC091280 TaxID=3365984 RepID=UPI0037F9E737